MLCNGEDGRADGSRLLCHALQFSFKSIAYYIRRATLINVCPIARYRTRLTVRS